jgi:hypothetical protein
MPAQTPVDLEAALKGQSPALAAKDAVYRLARSAAPDTKERLSGLVREGASAAIRRRAALGLSLVIDARTALLESVGVDEPSVLAHVLLSLARVGTGEDLKTIRVAAARLSGHDAEQARFAELLLAHRLGLGLDMVPPISTPPARQVPAHTKAVTLGSPQEAMRAWNRFAPNASLGFEPDSRRCAMIHCARRMILFIPSIQLAKEDGRYLLKDRTVVGATAANDRETASWYHDLWILSTPASGGVELQAWTQGGRACYTGQGHVARDGLSFELWTAESSRLALVRIRGRFAKDGLAIDGTVGDRVPSDSRAPRFRPRAQ